MHEFKVWAPRAQKLQLQLNDHDVLPTSDRDPRGWWTLSVAQAGCNVDYAYLVGDDPTPYPDPRSAWQPRGVHGPSRLYDQGAFRWTDANWHSPPLSGAILYELHIGTFSREGTFDGAIQHLDYLVDLGITHVEVMPVNEFAGNRGWGYDGVFLFAVFEPYGGPDGFKRFVDACHARNLAVILDVVYNHFGPVGNYASKFAPYLTDRFHTPWGAAVNFNEAGSDEVRRFFCDNALMWLKDFHVDGLRLDATHEYIDRSAVHFMEQLSAEVERLGATLGRKFVLIAESDLNDPKFVRPREAHGYGMDAQWSDDFHHSLFTLLWRDPGRGYYDDFGSMDDLVKSLKRVFVYDGIYSGYRHHSHGRPVNGLSAHHFVGYIQNHDQVGNRAAGERLEHLVGMEGAKVAVGIVLTAPFLPMLFMGEEFASSSPFLFFADHEEEEMRRLVSEGRKRDFAAFGWDDSQIPDPEKVETFERSKLDWNQVAKGKHAEMLAWVKQLIALRRNTVDLNDGDLGHVEVECREDDKSLMMRRGSVRVLANLGDPPVMMKVLKGESIRLSSREGIAISGNEIALPGLSLVVMMAASKG
ncbi:MAG TPA: malto-oligosyltrehalose trehalohydrolase [Acidobacteriaceae bacterium]|jgi:maltooligosyltrehalose trehalohydrolase|nr:malto-oligosyltrehalose trehalohydrolase [Acidobacteriaceae bacterium]